MRELRGFGLLIALSAIWGIAFVAIREADFQLSFVGLTLLRWFIVSGAYLVLYPFIVKPKTRFEWRDLPRLLVVGAFTVVVYHLSLNYAEKTVTASLAGLLISLGPIFATLLSFVVLHEKVGRKLVAALVLGGIGATIISTPDLNLGFVSLLGPLGVALSAFSYAVNSVAAKPLVGKYGPIPVAFWGCFAGTALLLPLASGELVTETASLSLSGWASVLYLSLLSTVVANLIFYTLLGSHSIPKLSVQLYLVPLVSVVGGIALLGEVPSLFTVAGGLVILLGVTIATRTRR
ncbi:MAG: DMT family transporter [Nitrososphaerales archaeon]|nr:DMT family transporter [Nitrososphaerales archaeon]